MIERILSLFQKHKKSYSVTINTISGKLEPTSFENKEVNTTCCMGRRHVITILGFIICCLTNANRLVIGVAIVAMVKHDRLNETLHRNVSELSCPLRSTTSNPIEKSQYQGEFDWNSKEQGYILGVGFFGYLIFQAFGGKVADTVGAKSPLVISNLLMGLLTFISPFAAWWNIYAILIVQFMRGLTQGFVTPAVYRMMSNWFPKHERGFLSTLVVCGYAFGAMIGGVVTGWLCDIPHLGWPSAFYFWGAFTMGIGILLYFLLYEYPQNHPLITEAELKYITDGQESDMSENRPAVPWRKIFTSVPCYAYYYGLFGHYWSISYFLSVHPTFMGTVLHFSMTENGATSCLPVVMKSVGGVIASLISKWLTKKNYVGVNRLRKGCTFIGAFGFSLCMLGIFLAGCNAVINILCFSLSLLSSGIALAGIMIAVGDMTPMFSGTLMGIASSIAGLSTVIIPVITGFLTTHETLSEWHSVFWISLGVVGSSGLVYVVFGSAEVQSWNFPEGDTSTKTNTGVKKQNDAELECGMKESSKS